MLMYARDSFDDTFASQDIPHTLLMCTVDGFVQSAKAVVNKVARVTDAATSNPLSLVGTFAVIKTITAYLSQPFNPIMILNPPCPSDIDQQSKIQVFAPLRTV